MRDIEDFVEQWHGSLLRGSTVHILILHLPSLPATLPVPTEREKVRERTWERGLGLRDFVRGIFLSMKSSEIRHRSIPPHARENLWLPSRVANYPGYFTLNSIKQSGGARL